MVINGRGLNAILFIITLVGVFWKGWKGFQQLLYSLSTYKVNLSHKNSVIQDWVVELALMALMRNNIGEEWNI
jgi:hypothetical protein